MHVGAQQGAVAPCPSGSASQAHNQVGARSHTGKAVGRRCLAQHPPTCRLASPALTVAPVIMPLGCTKQLGAPRAALGASQSSAGRAAGSKGSSTVSMRVMTDLQLSTSLCSNGSGSNSARNHSGHKVGAQGCCK